MKIEEWKLSTRTRNCLRRAGIRTVEELRVQTPEDLLAIRGFGPLCLQEVQAHLEGVEFKVKKLEPAPEGTYLHGYREGANAMRAELILELSRRIRRSCGEIRTVLMELQEYIQEVEVI